MKLSTTKLLASAAVLALSLGTVSQAQAFDNVDWNWDKQVTSVENITINVNDTFDWSGLVEIEKIQANIGEVSATSTVTGITNTPPVENGTINGGVVVIDETFSFDATYNDESPNFAVNPVGPLASTPGNPALQGSLTGGDVNEQTDSIADLTFHVTGEVAFDDIIVGDALDAVDLPEVVSVATAVANNQSIDSTSAVNLHDAQFNFGGFGEVVRGDTEIPVVAFVPGDLQFLAVADATDNTHTDALLGLTLAGALGIITPGEVSATSTVSAIVNATVDSQATAVGNNLSVNVEPTLPGDATLIADLTQFNFADTTATSSVSGVSITNYANLDVLDGPIVNSAATAVGNNVSISVGNFSVGE
ncbi:MAG: hypothetical protein WBK77_01200 [Alphaproteobacteria bacterium]